MSKPTSSSDPIRSKTPRTHYLNIYGPPPVAPAETAGNYSSTYPYPGLSPSSTDAQLPGVSQGGSSAYSPGPRRSVSFNDGSTTPLGRPQRDALGSAPSRGYLRYDTAGRADPAYVDRDPVTQVNTINAYSPLAAPRQLPGY